MGTSWPHEQALRKMAHGELQAVDSDIFKRAEEIGGAKRHPQEMS